MVLLRCQDCGNDYEGTKKDIDESECDVDDCGGSYEIKGSEEDTFSLSCDECSEDYNEPNEVVQFENAGVICKKCIDEVYAVKVVEKIIEVPKEIIKVLGFSWAKLENIEEKVISEKEIIHDVLKEILPDTHTFGDWQEIIRKCKEKGVDEDIAEEHIHKLMTKGDFYEPKRGYLRRI